jgi:hypothetical protein
VTPSSKKKESLKKGEVCNNNLNFHLKKQEEGLKIKLKANQREEIIKDNSRNQ